MLKTYVARLSLVNQSREALDIVAHFENLATVEALLAS